MKLAPVILENYTPDWKNAFDKEKAKILNVHKNINVEHIGSTAIEGMDAKPEIDILVGVNSLEDTPLIIKYLEAFDYVYFARFEDKVPERRYLRKSNGLIPLFHIHMVEKTSDFYKKHIMFRNILIENTQIRDKYSALKKELAEKYPDDRIKYSEGKKDFILNIINNGLR